MDLVDDAGGRRDAGGCGCAPACQIEGLFRLLCKTRMLDVLHALVAAPGPVRFVDLEARLRINGNTLSARLKSLVAAGLVTRTAHRETPPRVDYEATVAARRLRPVFGALHEWARGLDASGPGAPAPLLSMR